MFTTVALVIGWFVVVGVALIALHGYRARRTFR